jgi:hypothetical protein
VIAGESGSGKSTLTLQLAARGWRYLSDDSLVMRLTLDGVEVHGLRRFFAVTTDTMAAVLMKENSLPAPEVAAKQRLSPQDLFPGGHIRSARAVAILFPKATQESKSRMEKLMPFESMTRLLRLSPWAGYDKQTANAHLGLFGALISETEGYDLFAGQELMEDPAATVDLVSQAHAGGK